jgi:hypothetical protein
VIVTKVRDRVPEELRRRIALAIAEMLDGQHE